MIIIHMSVDLQCLKDFIKLCCIWNRYIDRMCCIYYVLDIFMVDSDRSAWFEVTLDDHRDLGIQYCTSCESAADRMVYFLRISARFCCQNKCFGYYCDRVINNNLVGKLCNTSASASASLRIPSYLFFSPCLKNKYEANPPTMKQAMDNTIVTTVILLICF